MMIRKLSLIAIFTSCQIISIHGLFFDEKSHPASKAAKTNEDGAIDTIPNTSSSTDANLSDMMFDQDNTLSSFDKQTSHKRKKMKKVNNKGDIHLKFGGEFEHTEELPFSSQDDRQLSLSRIGEFFQSAKHRDLLFKGGDNPWEEVPVSSDLLDVWDEAAKIVRSQRPDRSANNQIVAIYSTVPLLPGLKVDAVSYTGIKLLRSPLTGLPFYEFTLIKEYYLPNGSKGMKWLFQKVVGDKKHPHGLDDQCHIKDGRLYTASPGRQTHTLARVALQEDLSSRTFRIHYFGNVLVSCCVPKRLLSLLPLSQKAFEARVSQSIVQQLQREGVTSLKKYQRAVEAWAKAEATPNHPPQ
ncbi:unnamed protein product [Cylindrotheca closterium]|uniref:START domain-containing protein n=1 Tax=Cylindrotheca closterium TaxID=2856 RepID=A0AAD2GAA4_9STRA|nr:unnamed protein product [Cylindrotheca closterium]